MILTPWAEYMTFLTPTDSENPRCSWSTFSSKESRRLSDGNKVWKREKILTVESRPILQNLAELVKPPTTHRRDSPNQSENYLLGFRPDVEKKFGLIKTE